MVTSAHVRRRFAPRAERCTQTGTWFNFSLWFFWSSEIQLAPATSFENAVGEYLFVRYAQMNHL